MKIAIRGHESRKKEVAQILESFGGKDVANHSYIHSDLWYYLDSDNFIICSTIIPSEYKKYTLEEFEKEFPFKVGDLCIYYSPICGEIIVKILGLFLKSDSIVYEVDHKDSTRAHSHIYKEKYLLKPYKEMKEERNITLTLDKAKEWHAKGGELREIALQAFTEKELNPLPRSWEEFCERYSKTEKETYIGVMSEIYLFNGNNRNRDKYSDRNICPSQKSAEAHLAMVQLEQLRDCWRQGNIPQGPKYKIRRVRDKYKIVYGEEDAFLSFCNKQTAEEFLECFRDLIEKAADLI